MITLFRSIRKKLLQEGKTTNYLKYAIGEIALVVIGILVALQVNNWNEDRKAKAFEIKTLIEIKTSMQRDLNRTKDLLNLRTEIKSKSISNLIKNIQSDNTIPDSILKKNFENATQTLRFFYDSGPYESLKSKGLNYIENDSLRSSIIRFYEVGLPLYNLFIHGNRSSTEPIRKRLINNIVNYDYYETNTGWTVDYVLNPESLKTSLDLKQLLNLEIEIADNYSNRLQAIIELYEKLLRTIDNELLRLKNG